MGELCHSTFTLNHAELKLVWELEEVCNHTLLLCCFPQICGRLINTSIVPTCTPVYCICSLHADTCTMFHGIFYPQISLPFIALSFVGWIVYVAGFGQLIKE